MTKTPPQFAITGTGRSGTAYMRDALTASGVNAGHEDWFNPTGWVTEHRNGVDGLDGDVSWLAVPFVESGRWAGPVVAVTRHPVDTVRALLGSHFLTAPKSPWTRFALTHEPELADLPPLHRAVEWWVRWNERAAEVADVVVQVEDMRNPIVVATVGQVVGHVLDPAKVAEISTSTHQGGRSPTPAEVVWNLLDGRADQFGYTNQEVPA